MKTWRPIATFLGSAVSGLEHADSDTTAIAVANDAASAAVNRT